MIIIGMDVGLRSNGIVALDDTGKIIDLQLLQTYARESDTGTKIQIIRNDEDILIYNCDEIIRFIEQFSEPVILGLERLSYNSVSSSKDILCGIHWCIRKEIKEQLAQNCHIVSPGEWRKGIITHWDKVKFEMEYPNEDMNKLIPYLKIPAFQKNEIDDYLKSFRETRDCSPASQYDLSDAFWIAKYLIKSENKCLQKEVNRL